jgi:WD40 repeat protein
MLHVRDLARVDDDLPRLSAEIDFVTSPAVRDALASLGRTEDIRFSPDNRLAALAGYGQNTCLVLTVRIEPGDTSRPVIIDDCFEIRSPAIVDPHGFDFMGNDRLVIANRSGAITIFQLPKPPYGGRTFQLDPFRTISKIGKRQPLQSPGSVAVVKRGIWAFDIFACNTFHNRVSAHRIRPAFPERFDIGWIAAEAGLDIPDGVAVSPDGRFLAISNHNNHCVSIFELRAKQGPNAKIAGTLSGPSYPHGLRFSPDGKSIYVADAGKPMVYKFDAPDGNWAIDTLPSKSVQVLSDQVFLAGRHNDQEGGPKGLDLDRTGSIMAITCEEQPLAFFSVERLFG